MKYSHSNDTNSSFTHLRVRHTWIFHKTKQDRAMIIKCKQEIEFSDSKSETRFTTRSTVPPFWTFRILSQLLFLPITDCSPLYANANAKYYTKNPTHDQIRLFWDQPRGTNTTSSIQQPVTQMWSPDFCFTELAQSTQNWSPTVALWYRHMQSAFPPIHKGD